MKTGCSFCAAISALEDQPVTEREYQGDNDQDGNVLEGGLEPPRIAPYAPQAYVSTNSTTRAGVRRGACGKSGEKDGASS